jgi:pilus assembly protein CpaC
VPNVSPFATYLGLQTTITSVLNFLVSSGDAYTLADPKLSCRSGGTADFLAGGEVPIPVTNTTGQASVTFKPYGVKFAISPVVSDSGMIAASVSTELSAIDSTLTVDNIPGFVTRRTSTDVSLRDGQTLVLSGLLNDNANRAIDKVAGLGSLPILGPLFRSKEFQKNESDLVITVTPHFISPESELNKSLIEKSDAELKSEKESIAGKTQPKPAVPATDPVQIDPTGG